MGLPLALHGACSNLIHLKCMSSTDCRGLIPVLSGVCTNLRLLWICNDIYDTPFLKPPIYLCKMLSLTNWITQLTQDSASSTYRENFFMVFGARLQYLHIRPYRTPPYGHT